MRFVLTLLLCLAHQPAAHAAELVVREADLVLDFDFPGYRADLTPPASSGLVINPEDQSAAATLLRRQVMRGISGGFDGIYYDNRDRDHSRLPLATFPALTQLRYDEALRDRGQDYGLGGGILYPLPTFGNSSTAITGGDHPRSLGRASMTLPGGAGRAWLTWANNHIYIYPEHRDHDDHDLFPANWPYMLISQGSSYSDRPFMRAVGLIMAALPRATRDRAAQLNLIAPTVQMVFRRAQKGIYSREAYLSGAAHPVVFSKDVIAAERMVALAGSIQPANLPPAVMLRVIREDFSDAAGLAGLSERLFDTPSAIARLWRGEEYEKNLRLSAAATKDPNGRELQFSWVLLQGDPNRVLITPAPDGQTADIRIVWHDPFPVRPNATRLTSRVDIGVFAHNGIHDSALTILSVHFPAHQTRHYKPGPDGETRLSTVDYDAITRGADYDPILYWSAPWTDRILRGETGKISGRTRAFSDGRSEQVTSTETTYDINRKAPRKPVIEARTPQ